MNVLPAANLLSAIQDAGLPITGLSIPDLDNPDTWRFDGRGISADDLTAARDIVAQQIAAAAELPPDDTKPPTTRPPRPRSHSEQIAVHLAASYGEHVAYRYALVQQPNTTAALQALERARDHRAAAHDLDPDHLDPAWASDAASHAGLMTFYAAQLDPRR